MNQLHIACDISIRSGGLGLAALRYAQALSKAGSKVTLFVANRTSDELDFTNEDDFNLVSPILISNSFFFVSSSPAAKKCDFPPSHGKRGP